MEKKKKIIIVVMAMIIAIISTVCGYLYYDCNYNMPFTVKEEVVVEYGEDIPEDLNAYINIIDKESFKENDVTIDNKADNMKVGTHDCHIKWKKAEAITKVTVKDTKSPIIVLKNKTVKIKYGEKYNLKNNIKKAYDVIDGKLDVKIEGKLNNNKSGNQNFTVIATDKNGNETTKKFVVNVGKKPAWPKTYSDSTSTITIYKEWYQNAWVYAAHVEFSDYNRLKSITTNGTASNVANSTGAILTVNGPYMGGEYALIRNGEVIYDLPIISDLAIYNANNGKLANAGDLGLAGVYASNAVKNGSATDTFKFYNSTLVQYGSNIANPNNWDRAQRTFIGTNGKAGDIWICVSDGRYNDGESAGLTKYECASYLATLGCSYGVMLDGGGSSTMVFEGKTLNAAAGNERSVIDFLYFE